MLLKRLIQQNPVTRRDKPYAFNGSDRLSRPDKNLIAPALQNPIPSRKTQLCRQSQKLSSTNRFTMSNSRTTADHLSNQPRFINPDGKPPEKNLSIAPDARRYPQRKT